MKMRITNYSLNGDTDNIKEFPFPIYIDDKDFEKYEDSTIIKFLLLQAEIEELYRRLIELTEAFENGLK